MMTGNGRPSGPRLTADCLTTSSVLLTTGDGRPTGPRLTADCLTTSSALLLTQFCCKPENDDTQVWERCDVVNEVGVQGKLMHVVQRVPSQPSLILLSLQCVAHLFCVSGRGCWMLIFCCCMCYHRLVDVLHCSTSCCGTYIMYHMRLNSHVVPCR